MNPSKIFPRIARLMLVGAASVALGACATTGSLLQQSASPLPVDVQDSTGGKVVTTRAYETGDKLYVSGSMKKGFGTAITSAAHVDVRLIDSSGRIIAEKQDDIDPGHPMSSSGRSGRYSYVASFPLSEARQASKIVVLYEQSHKSPH